MDNSIFIAYINEMKKINITPYAKKNKIRNKLTSS